jgi:ribonuclease-3
LNASAQAMGAVASAPVDESEAAPGDSAPGETALGHRFARPDLLREALTHRSAAHPGRGNRARGAGSNERLEFIGDRVLGLLVAEWLAERFPREQEGDLGRRLAQLVSQPVLAKIAEDAGVPALLSVAPGESRAGVRGRATVLADAMEAAIGALYLDGGIVPARGFVRRAWEAAMIAQEAPPRDAKTSLQEWAQGRGFDLPAYLVESREGPPHAPVFVISVTVDGRIGRGSAGTKRAAEQAAASQLLGQLAPGQPLPGQPA